MNIIKVIKKYIRKLIIALVWCEPLKEALKHRREAAYFETRKQIKNDIKIEKGREFENFLSICAICKNEAIYLPEWIEYYKMIGVEKFYIYDNESDDNTKEVLASYIADGIVEYQFIRGKGVQKAAYNEAISKYKYKTKWLAFVDLDEFVFVKNGKSLAEFMKGFDGKVGLMINWVMYGDSGHKTKMKGLVIERFTKCSKPNFPRNKECKTIANPRCVTYMDIHFALYYGFVHCVDENFKSVIAHKKRHRVKKIQVNHYYGKSFEEYQMKKRRGKGTNYKDPYQDDAFNLNNPNDCDGVDMTMFIEPIHTELKKRNLDT